MEIRYVLNRDEAKEVIKNHVIDRYFNNTIPTGMEVFVTIESYGDIKVDVFEKEVETDE